MAHPIAPDYGQQFLFPPALEDWVPPDHPARFLREFVDQLDLPALQFVTPAASEGRPPFAPSLLLKIWLYGYFQRIRSTRKLEVACRDHLPLLWLAGLLAPDHNTLWRFWSENKKALRAIFKQTVQVALHTGAVGLALQALDGTKIQAAASGHSGWSKQHMEKLLAALDQGLDQTELKIAQENAELGAPALRLPAGLAQRQALREQIKTGLAQLAIDGRANYHPVEPEARRMQVEGRNRYAYNAQAVVDSQEGIVVACEATRQETDAGQLVAMIQQAQENLGPAAHDTTTVADGGYGAGADLQAAAQEKMTVLAPPAEGKPAQANPYAAQHFYYDSVVHTVTCPRGEILDYEGHTTKKGVRVQRFRCHCSACPVRRDCTRDPKGRQIEVWPHTPVRQAMRERLRQPAVYARWSQRCQIIERRFGQIKEHDGFRRWTVWGLESVRTQWSLLCATLNLRVLYRRWRSGRADGRGSAPAARAVSVGQFVLAVAGWLEIMSSGLEPIGRFFNFRRSRMPACSSEKLLRQSPLRRPRRVQRRNTPCQGPRIDRSVKHPFRACTARGRRSAASLPPRLSPPLRAGEGVGSASFLAVPVAKWVYSFLVTLCVAALTACDRTDRAPSAELATNGTVEVTARLTTIGGEFPPNKLYDYVFVMRYRVLKVHRGTVETDDLFVGHYNPLKPRAIAQDKFSGKVGGDVERFQVGDVHRMALEAPLDQIFMGGIIDKHIKEKGTRYRAIWTDRARE